MTTLSTLCLQRGTAYADQYDYKVGLIELQCADDIIAEWAFCTIHGDLLFNACIDMQDDIDQFRIFVPVVDGDECEYMTLHTEHVTEPPFESKRTIWELLS